ncbi:hypothetical protein PQR01_16590 [Paraburkholderia rhynchosiae]|uniref:Uncharacterized protein n=1 Tax=Paraburkholderia rhynchosiae TaxID=487049 RepID=A0ACC7NDG4_9BURK
MWTKKSTIDKVKEIWRFWLPSGLTDAAAIRVAAPYFSMGGPPSDRKPIVNFTMLELATVRSLRYRQRSS